MSNCLTFDTVVSNKPMIYYLDLAYKYLLIKVRDSNAEVYSSVYTPLYDVALALLSVYIIVFASL